MNTTVIGAMGRAVALAEQWRDFAPYTVGYNEVDVFLGVLRQAAIEAQFEVDEVERIGRLEAAQRRRADAAEKELQAYRDRVEIGCQREFSEDGRCQSISAGSGLKCDLDAGHPIGVGHESWVSKYKVISWFRGINDD